MAMYSTTQPQLPFELSQSDPVQYHRDCAAVTRAAQLRDGLVAPTPEYGLQPTPRPRDTAPDNTVVFVGGLQDNIPEILLRAVFSPFGTIDYVKKNATSFGFIKFVHREAAELAIEKLQGMRLRGVHLRLGWGKDQAPRQAQQPLEDIVIPYIHPCGAVAIQNAIQACGGLCSFAKVINALAAQEQENAEYAKTMHQPPEPPRQAVERPSVPEPAAPAQLKSSVISPFTGWYTEPTRLPSLSSSVESDDSFTVKSPSHADSRRKSDESASSSPPVPDTALWYSASQQGSNACDSSCSCDANPVFDMQMQHGLGSRGVFGHVGGPPVTKASERWGSTPPSSRDYTVNWVQKVSPIAQRTQRKDRLW